MNETQPSTWGAREALHLLNRAGFGGTPEEVAALERRGRAGAVAWLLDAEDAAGEFPAPGWTAPGGRRAMLLAARGGAEVMMEKDEAKREQARREARRMAAREGREQMGELRHWWLRRMLKTRAPLREKLTLFWHDHFATSIQKVRLPWLMFDQNELFRRHALGNFKALTRAVIDDGAMLIYLDTIGSQPAKPNENLARELLELFTLGAGHYSEADIRHAAGAFVGYRLDRASGEVGQLRRQLPGEEREFLGGPVKMDPGSVVEAIFRQPRCAEFITGKLWEYLAGTPAPAAVVERLAGELRAADYELAPLVRGILLSDEFMAPAVVGSRIKSPVEYVVMLARQLELGELPGEYVDRALGELGQELFAPPNVAGWDGGRAWINTNTLLARYAVAGILSTGGEAARGIERRVATSGAPDFAKLAPPELRESPEQLVAALCVRFFGGPVPVHEREAFEAYARNKIGSSLTDRELAELVHLMLSTPRYQLC